MHTRRALLVSVSTSGILLSAACFAQAPAVTPIIFSSITPGPGRWDEAPQPCIRIMPVT